MNWMLTFKTMPDETVIEDSTQLDPSILGPTYTVFLTTKRVLFRFNAIGSTMTQSFTYQEIEDAQVVTRMLIPYLCVRTKEKEFFIHTPDPAHWSARILETKRRIHAAPAAAATHHSGIGRREDLRKMLVTLQQYNLLSPEEVKTKTDILDKLQI